MAGDVEDFLRKLIEKQMAQQQQAPRRAAAPQRPVAQLRPAPKPARRPPPRPLAEEVVDVVEIVDAEPTLGGGVGRHVAQHMDTSEYQTRTGRLGSGVVAEDAAVQSHVQQALGKGPKGQLVQESAPDLAAVAPMTQSSGPTVGSQILGMMQSPADLRRAFILGEVLRRPSFDDL